MLKLIRELERRIDRIGFTVMQKNVWDSCDALFYIHDAAEHVVVGRPSPFAIEWKYKGFSVLFFANIIEDLSDKCDVFQFFDHVNTLFYHVRK